MSISQNFPATWPSLSLDFANSKTLDPRITFTRASTGTYVGADGLVKTAVADQARFDHDPVTEESLGLLIEESRTNLITLSTPQSGFFTGGGSTVNYNADTAPNNLTEACRITRTSTSMQAATAPITFSSNTVCLSCWAKAQGSNNYFVWSFQNMGGAIVRTGFKLEGDGETSIITNGNGGHTLQIKRYPNGWYRCIIIGNAQSSGVTTQFLYSADNYGEVNNTTGGSTLVWGFQMEAGSFPTSYIPTSGSSVTRSADVAQITGTDFSSVYNPLEGTLYLEAIGNGGGNTGSTATFQVDDGSSNNRITLTNDNETSTSSLITVGGTQTSFSPSPSFTTGVNKNAIAYKSGNNASSLNGSTVVTDSSVTTLPTVDRFRFGSNANGNSNNTIKKVAYYPKRLTNSQLQALTK